MPVSHHIAHPSYLSFVKAVDPIVILNLKLRDDRIRVFGGKLTAGAAKLMSNSI